MAKYNITNLNYIATGANRSFLNMDIELGYQIYDYTHLLCAENETSGFLNNGDAKHYRQTNEENGLSALHHDIGTEQGNGYWYPNRYIRHGEKDLSAIAKEGFYEALILNEQQSHYVETDPNQKKYIRLYLSCCTLDMKSKIQQFNRDREQVNCTYLLDEATNDKNVFTQAHHSIKDMYDIRDVTIQKQGTHESKNPELFNTDYHHDIYAPSMEQHPIGFVQPNVDNGYLNDAILMTQNTDSSPLDLKTTLLSSEGTYNTDTFYKTNIESNSNKTYTYCSKDDRDTYSSSLQPKRNFVGIQKSHLIDLPVDSAQVPDANADDVANYDDGEIYYLRIHSTKSAFNSQYSMQMPSVAQISNGRTYCGIGVAGGKPYLKYYDNATYNALSTDGDSLQVVATTKDRNTAGSYPYQKIEYIYPTDYAGTAKHKSNIFTIDILSTNIGTMASKLGEKVEDGNDSSYDDELLGKLNALSTDIAHGIRQIVEHITPANTQLFDVYFKED